MLRIITKPDLDNKILNKKLRKELIKEIECNLKLASKNKNIDSLVYKKVYAKNRNEKMILSLYFDTFGEKVTKKMVDYKKIKNVIRKASFKDPMTYTNGYIEIYIQSVENRLKGLDYLEDEYWEDEN